jgi:hypothetical protein
MVLSFPPSPAALDGAAAVASGFDDTTDSVAAVSLSLPALISTIIAPVLAALPRCLQFDDLLSDCNWRKRRKTRGPLSANSFFCGDAA